MLMSGLSERRHRSDGERQECARHNELRPRVQFHDGARARCRRNSRARRNSSFAGGQVLSSQRVDRMPRINNASRGQGSRNGNTRRYYPTLAVEEIWELPGGRATVRHSGG